MPNETRLANLLEKVGAIFKGSDSKKSETFSDLSFVETYSTTSWEIENVETQYKLITKVAAIPKSIHEISQTIISRKWRILDKAKEKEAAGVPDDLLKLISNPWKFYDFEEFTTLLILDLLISGNIFAYLVKDKSGLSLRRLDPQFIRYHENHGWEEQHPSSHTVSLDEKFLIQAKYQSDPYNPRWGKGVIANNTTLFRNIVRMLEFRENFYERGCFPGGVFGIENQGSINESQTKALIKERHQGSKNAGEPLVLTGKITYQQTQLDPTALKISEELTLLYKEAMSAFGLPRYMMELGLRDGGQKYNNHALQDEHFLKATVIPIAKRIESVFNNVIQRVNQNWIFKFDIAAEIFEDATLQAMSSTGIITPNEHRTLIGMPKADEDGMDTHWLSSASQPMDLLLDPPEPIIQPPAQPVPPIPPEPQKPKAVIPNGKPREKSWRDLDYLSEPANGIWEQAELAQKINVNRIRRDFVTLNTKTRTKKSRESLTDFKKFLVDEYSNVIASVARHASALDKISQTKPKAEQEQIKSAIDKIITEIYSEEGAVSKLEKITLPLHKAVGEATFSNAANVLTVGVSFLTTDPGVAAKLNILRENGPLVANTTKNKIAETIQAGIADGKTHTEIAKDLWIRFVDDNNNTIEEFSKIYRPGVKPKDFDAVMTKGGKLVNRASLIARTEVAYANKMFSAEAMEKSGVVKSVTIIDCDPCPVCAPHQNVPVSFEKADTINNLHPNCTGTIVPAEIGIN